MLSDATVILECVVEDTVKAGDHYIVVGRVVKAYRLRDGEPLVLLRGTIHSIGEEVYSYG